MISGSFEYHRPKSLDEAVGLLDQHGDDARVVAGGHSLIPMMKLRMAMLDHLIDLQAIDGLKGVREEGGNLLIGAMTTQSELIADPTLAAKCPIMAETALQIADPQVRYCGTIGGNVANGDPGNDMPALMQALDATYIAQGPNGTREIAARVFYEAVFFTALQDNEIITAVRIPTPPDGHGHAYEKQKRKIGDYATAAAAVLLTMSGGRCATAAIALTNVGDTPLYAEDAAAALIGTAVDAAAIDRAVALAEGIASPAADARGPVDFRTKLAGVMVRRAIARALERAA
ncbi:MAG: xanthine dehydrogenase family protein subunit M [Alphaproteobacteria bacterium]|nr:xanthine dehydrogenase family protein subunit M [Alphaproteobacteria bacterium]